MLFRIKGKSKKPNAKSCNHLHRKINNPADKSHKPKETCLHNCSSEKTKHFEGDKENMGTLKWMG
jgi:hypothetical protein